MLRLSKKILVSLLASWLQINGSEQSGWNSAHLSACHVLWWSKVSYKCPWPFQRQRTGFPVWYCRSHYEPCDPLWRSSSTTGFEYKIHMKSCVATCGLSFFLIYLQLPWRIFPARLPNLASLSPVSNVATYCFLTFSGCQMWLALRKSLFKGDSAILLWIEFLLWGPTMNECLPPLDTSCSLNLVMHFTISCRIYWDGVQGMKWRESFGKWSRIRSVNDVAMILKHPLSDIQIYWIIYWTIYITDLWDLFSYWLFLLDVWVIVIPGELWKIDWFSTFWKHENGEDIMAIVCNLMIFLGCTFVGKCSSFCLSWTWTWSIMIWESFIVTLLMTKWQLKVLKPPWSMLRPQPSAWPLHRRHGALLDHRECRNRVPLISVLLYTLKLLQYSLQVQCCC